MSYCILGLSLFITSRLKMTMSLFWKNARFPRKGQNGAKVGRAVGKNQLFCILLKIGSLDFFNILYKVRGY